MTSNDEDVSLKAIELCRGINRKAAAQYHERGISTEDVALASLHSAYDLALVLNGGDAQAALAWLRGGIDVLERSLVEQGGTVQ